MSQGEPQQSASHSVPGVFNWKIVRKALRAAEEGVYCWYLESGEIYYTEQCLRMMGLPIREHAPNIFTQADITIHEDDRAFFLSEVQRYLNWPMTTPLRVEVRLLNQRSRGWRWIRVNGLIERDEHKQPLRLVGVWVDITRRKMTDLHAMEEKDLFRTLINYLPDNIYFKNRESRFVLANESTARKMGVPTPSDLIGSKDTNFFADATVAREEELEVMSSRKPITNRIHLETWKGGQRSWSRISKFPWYASDGSVKGIVGISSDVTELIETQERYYKMAQQLDERNRLLEREINLAREVQRALQPQRLADRIWDSDSNRRIARFHHVYMPSSGVAGDFYDVYPVGDAGIGMLICDVMGHGVRAALIASMIRGLMMEQASHLTDTPGLLLSSLNRQLFRIFDQSNITMFSTACYVYLDLKTRRLTLSGAGHPAPIILSPDGAAFLPPIPRSPALGLLESAMYRESEIVLEPGTKLMLYTDGLVEAMNHKREEIGAQRIMDFLRQRVPQNIREMIDIAFAGMQQFTGKSQQDDDISILGVEFIEESR